MAKNGKKSFLDFFKVDESSDEYEDDLFEDDEYDDDDEEDFEEDYVPKTKAVNGRASSFLHHRQQPSLQKSRNLQKLPEHQLQHHQAIQNLYLLTTEAREVPSRYLLLNQMNLMMPR